jgi:stage III sporulation protein AD
MDMLQLGALAVAGALCAVVVKQRAPDVGLVLGLMACILLLVGTLPAFEEIRDMMGQLRDMAGISEAILTPVLQTVGLAIVTKLAGEVCRDAGESGIAGFVELAGGVAAVLVALPLLKMVLQLIGGLL